MELLELKEGGTFRGRYLDAYGHQSNIVLELVIQGEKVEGKCLITLVDEHESPPKVEGIVTGRVAKGQLSLELQLGANREESMKMTSKVVKAGSYARSCLMGEVLESPQNFGGGVWIAWQFTK